MNDKEIKKEEKVVEEKKIEDLKNRMILDNDGCECCD